jgi:hypothetical protein
MGNGKGENERRVELYNKLGNFIPYRKEDFEELGKEGVKLFFEDAKEAKEFLGSLDIEDSFGLGIKPAFGTTPKQEREEKAFREKGVEIIRKMKEEYQGGEMRKMLDSLPPMLILNHGFTLMVTGGLFPDTNIVMVNSKGGCGGSGEVACAQNEEGILTHELHHYAAYLGRGAAMPDDMWIAAKDGTVLGLDVYWLDEGLTELYSDRFGGKHGMPADKVAYPFEVVAVSLIEQLTSPKEMKEAYFSGNFSTIRDEMDARFGEGAFEKIMESENGIEAIRGIKSLVEKEGLGWEPLLGEPTIQKILKEDPSLVERALSEKKRKSWN